MEIPTPTLPPEELMRDCPDRTHNIRSNQDLAEAYNYRGDVIRLCNADKKALREWAEHIQKEKTDETKPD